MNDLKSLEEMKDLSIQDYNRLKEDFINDAKENYEVYRGDLMYQIAIDLLKSSELAISSLNNYYLTALQAKNDITHQEVEKIAEKALKYDKQLSKELNKIYKNSELNEPSVATLKTKVDELITGLRKIK